VRAAIERRTEEEVEENATKGRDKRPAKKLEPKMATDMFVLYFIYYHMDTSTRRKADSIKTCILHVW